MDFFEHQRRARRQSRRLVWLFLAAVLAVVLVIDAVVLLAFGLSGDGRSAAAGGWTALAVAHWPLLAVSSLVTGAVIGLASLGRIGGLRAGGAAVARQLGGTEVPADTTDASLRRLCNVVEEIAIASSLPVPDIFVLENEPGINAFAAGWAPGDAAIAVTRGALDRLNRDELQGVVAHEFSHVLNGDMRLNIRLMGLLFGLLVLGIVGRKTLRVLGRGRRSKDTGPIILIALAVMIMGYVGLFLGRLIKAGVSRSREYLADASAVQFTRQSTGIAGALKKIGGLGEGSRIAHADGEEVSHMLFGSGQGLRGWWATHPPLERRIAALDPSFQPSELARLGAQWRAAPPSGMAEDLALGLAAASEAVDAGEAVEAGLPAGGSEVRVSAEGLRRHVGNPDQADFGRAGSVLDSIPAPLRQAARDRSRALALVAALLQDPDPAVAARQRALWLPLLARQGLVDVEGAFDALVAACRELHPLQRLPLAELAFPQLRRRPRPELEAFMDAIEQAIHVDGRVDLFEYALGRMVKRQVLESLDPVAHWKPGRRRLAHSRSAVVDVLRVLAAHAGGSEEQSARAFAAGVHRVLGAYPARYEAPHDAIALLDLALPQLDALEPLAKAVLVEGLVEAASHDGRLSLGEAELVRVVCATLQCPMPPVLEDLPLAA